MSASGKAKRLYTVAKSAIRVVVGTDDEEKCEIVAKRSE